MGVSHEFIHQVPLTEIKPQGLRGGTSWKWNSEVVAPMVCLLRHYVFGMWKKARAWIELQLEPVATTWITYHCLGDAIRNWQRPFLQIFDKWGIFIGHFHWNAPTWQQINRTMPSPVQLAKYHKLAEPSRAPVGEKQMQFPEFSLCIMKTPLKG